jgi:hypothetical protein
MNRHAITWTQPSPFWSETATHLAGVTRPEFARPAILRFTTDSFMDELINVLETDPRRLGEYRVRPETWRGFAAPPAPLAPKKIFALPFQRLGAAKKSFKNGTPSLPTKPPPTAVPDMPLKLYAPAAQRYYFVASCLVCQMPGLPDRHIEPARAERVGFLVRRLLPPNKDASQPKEKWEEHAWIKGTGANFWRKLTADEVSRPAPNEERLPMFAMNFTEDDLRQRRLLAGLIPVGKRETYLGGALATSGTPPGTTVKTARKILFRKEIAEPWKALIAQAASAATQLADPPPALPPSDDRAPTIPEKAARLTLERSQIQATSWLILVDFDRFLRQYLPRVHATVHGTPTEPPTPEQFKLLDALDKTKVGPSLQLELKSGSATQTIASSMTTALAQIDLFASKLENNVTEYERGVISTDWPNFLFPLADPTFPAEAPLPPSITPLNQEEIDDLATDSAHPDPALAVDNLTVLVVRALPVTAPDSEPAVPPSAVTPADALDGWFVLRCAYERPACGPLHDDVLSPRTEPFQFAGFFDPDAPARPIRIGLPLDISPAGLRKFDKNTAFVMSDMLCGQLKRFKGITFGSLVRSVLPFPFHKDLSVGGGDACTAGGNPIGTICSLSIPIITICALILLIIIVTLLDIIFHWLPFFIVCFPIPGLKGKKT